MKKWKVWMILILTVVGFNAIMLKFMGPPSHILASMGAYDCVSRVGECGGTIPGKGYPCTDPGAICGQGEDGDKKPHCITKANWFWGCICECSC